MVVKRSVQCRNCRNYLSYYTEERQNPVGITLVCECCGMTTKCIDYESFIPKWICYDEEVENER